jgi:hypothetical protein
MSVNTLTIHTIADGKTVETGAALEPLKGKIVSGQNEINRMQAELKMVTGMLVGMLPPEEVAKCRRHQYRDDNGLGFWTLDETISGVEIICFVRKAVPQGFYMAWATKNVDCSSPHWDPDLIMGVQGVKPAYDILDVLITGMLRTYPHLRTKLSPMLMSSAV